MAPPYQQPQWTQLLWPRSRRTTPARYSVAFFSWCLTAALTQSAPAHHWLAQTHPGWNFDNEIFQN